MYCLEACVRKRGRELDVYFSLCHTCVFKWRDILNLEVVDAINKVRQRAKYIQHSSSLSNPVASNFCRCKRSCLLHINALNELKTRQFATLLEQKEPVITNSPRNWTFITAKKKNAWTTYLPDSNASVYPVGKNLTYHDTCHYVRV